MQAVIDERYTRNPEAISRTVDGEVLIVPALGEVLDLDDVFYRLADPVSVRVWELLAEPRTLDWIATQVAEEFEVQASTAREDIERFLAELTGAGAARRAP